MSAAPPVFLDLRANGDAESHLFALARRGVFFRGTGGQDGLLGSGTRTKRCLHDGDAFFVCRSLDGKFQFPFSTTGLIGRVYQIYEPNDFP